MEAERQHLWGKGSKLGCSWDVVGVSTLTVYDLEGHRYKYYMSYMHTAGQRLTIMMTSGCFRLEVISHLLGLYWQTLTVSLHLTLTSQKLKN